MILEKCPFTLAICRFGANEPIEPWALKGSFFSITRTEEELSIICEQNRVPQTALVTKNWKALRIRGPLDFGLVGVLNRLLTPLSHHGISIISISTYDTDYVLIQESCFTKAIQVLTQNGYSVNECSPGPS